MVNLKPLSLIAVFLLIGAFSFNAFSAITTTFDYSDPLDYELETDYNQSVVDNGLVLGERFEYQLNDFTDSTQSLPSFIEIDNNRLFVTWISRATDPSISDSDQYIAGKIIDKFGNTIVSEFQVNQFIDGSQLGPAKMVLLENGNVMIIFSSFDTNKGDESSIHVAGIVYNQEGSVVVDEFQINELTDGAQNFISATSLRNGNVFVSWTSDDTSDPADTIGDNIAGKIIGPDGSTVLGEFVVNETADDVQNDTHTFLMEAADQVDDKVILIWRHGTSSTYDLYAKIFNTDGSVSRGEFILFADANIQTPNDFLKIGNDEFLVTYDSTNTAFDNDNSSYHVGGLVIDSGGNELVAPFQINQEIENIQFGSHVALLSDGNIHVVWSSNDTNHAGDDDSSYHVAGIVIEIDDLVVSVVEDEYQVNRYVDNSQIAYDLTVMDGSLIHAYSSVGETVPYSTDSDSMVVLGISKEDLTGYFDVSNPSSILESGVIMTEALREIDVEYGVGNEGYVSFQISNDDGANWYYFDGESWAVTVEGFAESNIESELNDNLASFWSEHGKDGEYNVRIFLRSDGSEAVILDLLSLFENEIPVIGNGEANIYLEVEENKESVANLVNTGVDEDEVEYSIVGGNDQSLFSLVDNLLKISLDGELEETYEVQIQSTDEFGGASSVQTFEVTVVRVEASNGSSSGSSGKVVSPFVEDDLEIDLEVEKDTESDEPEPADKNNKGSSNNAKSEITQDYLTRVVSETKKGELCVEDFMSEYKKLSEVSRLNAIKLFLDLLCEDVTDSDFLKKFSDTNELSALDQMYINKAFELRLIQGYPDGSFRPQQKVNYAELSALLFRSSENYSLESNPWFLEYVKAVRLVEDSRLEELVTGEVFVREVSSYYGI